MSENYKKIINSVSENVKVVAVSKTQPAENVFSTYNAGCRIFGENRVQEVVAKSQVLPRDIKWHFIGHLQTNKVRFIAPFITMIQSVDSLKLLQEINKEAKKHMRVIDCLLEFHIAKEESKQGFSIEEANAMLAGQILCSLKNVRICGVMGMATFTDNKVLIKNEFSLLKQYFDHLKITFFSFEDYFCEISMGMSNDYALAIEEGSTMVRIGSAIFGERK